MSRHAVPDHRLVPKLTEELQKLPRNARRVQKRIVEEALRTVVKRIIASQETGAGFSIDALLREFLAEYNDRILGHGLLTLPQSFNDTEAFFNFNEKPTPHLLLRPEKDHIFSFGDFLDFATDPARSEADAPDRLAALPEGIIHSFTPLGDVHDTAFLHSDSERFITAGFTLVRLGAEVNWVMLGGPVCDLALETQKLRDKGFKMEGRPPEKRFIDCDPSLELRAEPLQGSDDIWKTVFAGRFNLTTRRFVSRSVFVDHGNHYFVLGDDPTILGKDSVEALTPDEHQRLESMAAQMAKYALQYEIVSTCLLLPAYFAHRITLVRETSRPTSLAAADTTLHRTLAAVPESARPKIRRVAALEIIDVNPTPRLRAYSHPSYKVEVDGFWRRLRPGQMGRDASGAPIAGRTWVRGHMRWRDLPSRPATIYVKSTLSSARARAAALSASNASATVVRDVVPNIPPETHSDEGGAGASLYVMRCPLMDDDVFKIGWTSKPPRARAEELSRATGVPLSFVVVESWRTNEPRLVENMVHEALSEFRISTRREFFKAPFQEIRRRIVAIVEGRPVSA